MSAERGLTPKLDVVGMRISERLITIGAGANIQDAAQRMMQFDVGALAVWDRGKLRMVITESDVARAVADRMDPVATRVRAYARRGQVGVEIFDHDHELFHRLAELSGLVDEAARRAA